MNNIVKLLAFSALPLLLAACETTRTNYASRGEVNSIAAELATHRNEIVKTNANLKQIHENQQQLYLQLQSLETRINVIGASTGNKEELTNFQREIQALRNDIRSVDNARVSDNKKLAEALNAQLNTYSNQINNLNSAVKNVSTAVATRPTGGTATSSNTPPPGEYVKHTVSAGDTLGAIAHAYGVTVKEIQTANRLSGTTIGIGQTLLIPKK